MSTSLTVKCHLPLITTRIEFQFNVLSPQPQITPRRDFGAVIRCQARRNTPYTRSTRGDVPVTARRAESPLTEIADSDSDTDGGIVGESTVSSHKIPKPKGEPGRSNSGGYNLQDAMGWNNKEFTTFTVSRVLSCSIKSPHYLLNRNTSMMRLERNLISRFATVSRTAKIWTKSFNQYEFRPSFWCFSYRIIQTAKRFKIQDRYNDDWPIHDALKLRLKNTSDLEKKRSNRKIEAKLKEALRPND